MKKTLLVFLMSVSLSWAATNPIRFQGRLTDGQGRPVVGPSVNVRFSLYGSASGGAAVWQGPANQTVATNEAGLFSTDMAVPMEVVGANEELYLQVHVNDGTGLKPLSPRQKLASVPYAMYATVASSAASIADFVVSTSKIASGAVTEEKIADGAVTDTKVLGVSTSKLIGKVASAQIDGIDITQVAGVTGVIVAFGGQTAPNGWLMCDGAEVSRSIYANLFAVIGTSFGAGNGSTTFNLPDLRGRFLRGRDAGAGRDPDANTRTAMNAGGNSGNGVGSVQSQSTDKNSLTLVDPGHVHHLPDPNPGQYGVVRKSKEGEVVTASAADIDGAGWQMDVTSAPKGFTVEKEITGISVDGGSETRPANAYVNYIIKY